VGLDREFCNFSETLVNFEEAVETIQPVFSGHHHVVLFGFALQNVDFVQHGVGFVGVNLKHLELVNHLLAFKAGDVARMLHQEEAFHRFGLNVDGVEGAHDFVHRNYPALHVGFVRDDKIDYYVGQLSLPQSRDHCIPFRLLRPLSVLTASMVSILGRHLELKEIKIDVDVTPH